jgi:hypothetical protein
VLAFLDKRAADSKKLWTDGKRLDGLWMGGRGIAEWVGDKVVLGQLDSRSKQTIQRMIRREAPANWLKPNAGRRTSRRRQSRRSSRSVRRASLRRNSRKARRYTGEQYYVVAPDGGEYLPRQNTRASAREVAKEVGGRVMVSYPATGPIGTRGQRLVRNTSLVKQGADASALALMKRIEAAVGSGAYDVAHVTFERLDEWKRRFGAWPFDSKRYWRAVDEMQRGSQASIQRNTGKSSARQRAALWGLYAWAIGSDRTGNPYTKSPVREAIIALGDARGYDLPAKRPSSKAAGALYDLAKWATGGDRTGNPHSKPVVRAACKALGGDGYDLPTNLRSNSRRRRTSRR